ncbi:cobalamin biosynthesis protein CbiD [Methylococcus capsulatus str. Bath]|uniref:Cobalt-precorrin-5B C(1)-methyltransferase n=1 Tax=Methylococcus capsulatus (strain ATCC 33009 / NCIMB 11132 / Bath) TaxID=243233 RepID=CBID_METCA|nr:cobalt-precorrin-5B (C(1))-methyltransferase [Methylococcus capsulatus]Q605I7.1 RecName: Full=Cobalt-precorrin-5B C(1)-methyltransferase; AltName: Full=Cobalt-precorrin-6A synthase [Methylococcus capsulatus str. Bath]AAU91665.1 cobalamin biosynthesis protein CbiD [Methylococcus capsulatus str. Bath]
MEKKPKGTRTGYTTGACSAAAARAATLGLVRGRVPDQVECELPNGQRVVFAVTDGRCEGATAHAVVIKDAGDDPDVTDKARLTADVALLPEAVGAVVLKGGEGVGTITRQGLGLEVGGPAINPVPRRNIEANVREAAGDLLERAGLEVVISVPGGEEIAKRTLNYRLGIVGGISILGTTGIVHPYSTAAFRASVIQAIEVAANQGQDVVVLTTGGRTERFVMNELPQLPPVCFVQMGDFLKYALDTVVRCGLRHVVIGGMVGKLTKIAQGETITHANRNAVDTDLLADIAAEVGAPAEVCADIRNSAMARYASERMEDLGLITAFYEALGRRVIRTLRERYPDRFTLRILMCDFEANKLAEVAEEDSPGLRLSSPLPRGED